MPTSLDPQLLVYVAVATAIVLTLLLAGARSKRAAKLAASQQQARAARQEKEVASLNKQLLEVRSVVIGLGQKVTEQQDIIQLLSERIRELENTDNDGRLYSRASKMVKLGADVNELIQECELPKAEAELMLSLQNKIATKQDERSGQPRSAAGSRAAAPVRGNNPSSAGYAPRRPHKR